MNQSPPPVPAPPDYAQLFEQAPSGYVTTLDDGTITHANQTFLTWTGYRLGEVVGVTLPSLMPVGDRILYSTHVAPMLQLGGAIAEIAIEIIAADRSRRSALLSAARTPASAAGPALTRVIIFGAHERRRYEKELVQAQQSVEEARGRRRDAEERLEHQARHDGLTGLVNRAGLTDRLGAVLDEQADGPAVAVFFVDLDHFKAVNDGLGREAGDELLRETATRLARELPGVLARLEGDEFAAFQVVPGADAVPEIAHRLLDALRLPVVLAGLEVVVTASIGVALAAGPDTTADGLLRRADIAMYQSKAGGRNGWTLHDGARKDPAEGRLSLLGELRRGIPRDELRLHYQPRYDLVSSALHSFEALVRWQHPTRGLVPPYRFIEIAEESGLIHDLGAWVLNEALGQAVGWQRQAPAGETPEIAVNLSARQLAHPGLVPLVGGLLESHGLDPALLTLEITETALISGPDAAVTAQRALTGLKELGVVLSVDDFGTGYSSFLYLKQFPIDELKIDRSFVSGLGLNPEDTAIVTSCVQLAHAIGARCVAEGIETELQRELLVDVGCDLGQGFLLGHPAPVDQIPLPRRPAVIEHRL